jgi:hypothetical protein
MAGPIIVGILYSLLVIILCFFKPNAGRIFLGIFFLAMGLGVNLPFLLTIPSFIVDYGRGAWVPLFRTLTENIIALNPVVFGVLLILFEVIMGIFLLSKGVPVKVGLIGTMIFILLLIPLHMIQLVWAISAAAHVYLLTKSFNTSLLEMIKSRIHKHT